MLIDLVLLLGIYFVKLLAFLLPDFDLLPDAFHVGLVFFFGTFAKLNFILPIDTIFTALGVLVNFVIVYYTAILIVRIFNFITGREMKI